MSTLSRDIRSGEHSIAHLEHTTRLAKAMAPDPREWEYTGEVTDAGFGKTAKCACGHPIRYIFWIRRPRDGATLPIGSTCIEKTMPYLIAEGAPQLAAQLKGAHERLQANLREQEQRERAAVASARYQVVRQEADALWEWYGQVGRKAQAAMERDGRLRRPFLPPYWYEGRFRALRKKADQSTPGRAALSLENEVKKFRAQIPALREALRVGGFVDAGWGTVWADPPGAPEASTPSITPTVRKRAADIPDLPTDPTAYEQGRLFNPTRLRWRQQPIPVEVADQIPGPVEIPDGAFRAAIAGTPGASLSRKGLRLQVTRFQNREQTGDRSIREGIFYLPTRPGTADVYAAPPGTVGIYGGTVRIDGETRIKRPLVVRGTTGGTVPRHALATLLGEKPAERVFNDIFEQWERATTSFNRSEAKRKQLAEATLREHGWSPSEAERAATHIAQHSGYANILPLALLESIAVKTARDQGYDAIVGIALSTHGKPYISEVVDLRESHYPSSRGFYRLHPAFIRAANPAQMVLPCPVCRTSVVVSHGARVVECQGCGSLLGVR